MASGENLSRMDPAIFDVFSETRFRRISRAYHGPNKQIRGSLMQLRNFPPSHVQFGEI